MRLIDKLLTAGATICLIGMAADRTNSAFAQGLPSKAQVEAALKNSMGQFTPYESAKGFRIKYPASWEPAAPNTGLVVVKFRTLKGLVSARMAVEDLPAGTTLQTYAQATNIGVKTFMAQQGMPATFLGEGNTTLAGIPASQTSYTYNLKKTTLAVKVLQIMAVRNGRGYCFNYTAASDLYDPFFRVFVEMVKSIEWT